MTKKELLDYIREQIRANGNREISGDRLQEVLMEIVEYVDMPTVTQADTALMRTLYGAVYNGALNAYAVTIAGATRNVTPEDMALLTMEYMKVAADGNYNALYANSAARYILCKPMTAAVKGVNLASAFANSTRVEIIDLNATKVPAADMAYAFANCPNLRTVAGNIQVTADTPLSGVFSGCTALEDVTIYGLAGPLDLSPCERLTAKSLQTLFEGATNAEYTVTVSAVTKTVIDNTPEIVAALAARPLIKVKAK